MTAREWLLREFEDELRTQLEPDMPEEPWLDPTLSAAKSDTDLSDHTIDLLMELGDPAMAAAVAPPVLMATDPSIAARRNALGISIAQAAHELGVSPAGYESIERMPLRWLNVRDTGLVAVFLDRLGVQTGVFLRWLAAMRPDVAAGAWGYRPGAVLDRPVDVPNDDQGLFLKWGEALLASEAVSPPADDRSELFGYVWSPSVVARQSADILSDARGRLLASDLRMQRPTAPADASVIALETAQGLAYPAFQFDPEGRLIPIVGEVNAILGAEADPWGVADWWLGEDDALRGRPVDLLGSSEDHDRLRRAARALAENG